MMNLKIVISIKTVVPDNMFGKLVSSKTAVGLESAMKLLQMEYKGQIHTELSDSYNTARIASRKKIIAKVVYYHVLGVWLELK